MTEDAGEEKGAPCGDGELGDKRENGVFGVDGVWVGLGRLSGVGGTLFAKGADCSFGG